MGTLSCFDRGHLLKWLSTENSYYYSTKIIFPFRWVCFPNKIGRNAQWEHLFSMYFDDVLTICLIS